MNNTNTMIIVENMLRDLTRKQQEVLDFLIHFEKIKRRTPSYLEIAQGVGLAGKQNVYQIMKYLFEKGYVTKGGNGKIFVNKDLTYDVEWMAKRVEILETKLKTGLISKKEYLELKEQVYKKFQSL